MQSPLTAITVSAISATTNTTKSNICRTHTPAAAVAVATTLKTPIVIQKSESFHVENDENLVIRNSGYPKLKRTTSSDIEKSIFNFGGSSIKTRSTTQDTISQQPHCQQVKTKSDYSLVPDTITTTSTTNHRRNLYENFQETYESFDNKEKQPLLSATEELVVREINVKNDENNAVLVYQTKNTKEKSCCARKLSSVPVAEGINNKKIENTHKVAAASKGSNWRHSWYAPVYGVLEEEGEHSIKESASLHNLAGVKKLTINGTHESASLLDNNQYTTTTTSSAPTASGRVVPCTTTTVCIIPSGVNDGTTTTGDATLPPMGQTAPRKRKFEQFLKNLVSRRASKEPASPPLITTTTSSASAADLLKAGKVRSPSEQNLTRSRLNGGSTASLTESVHQKLWSVVPLLRKNGSCGSLHLHPPRPATFAGIEYMGLRKCETVLALTHHHHHNQPTSGSTEPIRPLNRLRHCTSIATCSRCSSLLSLAGGSKYSLNVSTGGGGFIPVSSSGNFCSGSHSGSSHTSSSSSTSQPSVVKKSSVVVVADATTPSKIACKLCLGEFKTENLTKISQCGCSFCTECMTAYVEFEIAEGAYEVSCPDAMCPAQGVISIAEITLLAAPGLVEKHHRYRLNREVEMDKYRTWCPKAGCETICLVGPMTPSPSTEKVVTFQPSSSKMMSPCAVHCPTCRDDFCSGCKKPWHPTITCEENTKRLAATGKIEILGIPFDSDLIKCCPMCAVPIEKDEGCAQMMCKRCKHVFCWYCLASLDDDFLLRHYDKGPCKNKLGHSRASVVWHRAQVIGIFAGFGILLLVASPLLLLAAPCIVCCKCRICSGAAKLEDPDTDLDDGITLQR